MWTQEEVDLRIELEEGLRQRILKRIRLLTHLVENADALTTEQVNFLSERFLQFIGILPIAVDTIDNPNFIFERLTINRTVSNGNNFRLTNLEQIGYPPLGLGDKIDYNRANLRGSPMFYSGASGSLPVTVETKPKFGQLITESTWKLKQGESLQTFVLYHDEEIAMRNPDHLFNQYAGYKKYLNTLPSGNRAIVEAGYKFVVNTFTKKVNPTTRQEYLLSALFSNYLINHPSTPVDAIFYPSVANNGSFMNVAITPKAFHDKLQFVKAKELIVTNAPSRSNPGWFGTVSGDCKEIESDTGILQWMNCPMPNESFLLDVIKNHNIQF